MVKNIELNNKLKILHVGVYSDPKPIGGNNLLWCQANVLLGFNYDVHIITWPKKDYWSGEMPCPKRNDLFEGIPFKFYKRDNLSYHVIDAPDSWGDDVSSQVDWVASVEWAKKVLLEIKPDILHQHYWKKMWFFMEAAIQLKIPTIYTVYDYGLPCIRQFLVTSENQLCKEKPNLNNCYTCEIKNNINSRKQIEKHNEISELFKRWSKIANNLNALIVTSPFAKELYTNQGVNNKIIFERPWFYNQKNIKQKAINKLDKNITIGFIGRLVPEKGLHILLDSLLLINNKESIKLRVAGHINNGYSQELFSKYKCFVGRYEVDWLGWINNQELSYFFNSIDVLVVPSIWYDNTPSVLIEAIAHGCPVICSDVPSMTHIIKNDVNGLVFKINNSQDLALQIEKFSQSQSVIDKLSNKIETKHNLWNYGEFLSKIYQQTLNVHV